MIMSMGAEEDQAKERRIFDINDSDVNGLKMVVIKCCLA